MTKSKPKQTEKNSVGRRVVGECFIPALWVMEETRNDLAEVAEFVGKPPSDFRKLALKDAIAKVKRWMKKEREATKP